MIRAKNGNIIFKNQAELNTETNRRIDLILEKKAIEYKAEATERAMTLLLPIIGTVLYETFGFGQKRLDRFAEGFDKHLECIEEEVLTLEQYQNWCKEQGYACLIVGGKNE